MPFLFLILSIILTLAGFFSQYGWGFDLATHFRLQYFLILLFCAILCFLQKRKYLFICCLIFAAVNLALIVPLYFPSKISKGITIGKPITILLLNVHTGNTDFLAVRNYLLQTSPDILALEEINAKWAEELKPVLENYPFFQERSQENNFGIGLYSKIAFTEMAVKEIGEVQVPSVVGKFIWEEQPVSLILMHPVPPASQQYFNWRNEHIDQVVKLKAALTENVILLGDLNTTSWSFHFQKLIDGLDLKDSREGFGLQTSWPSFLPYLGITIDHCLISQNFTVLKRKIGPNVGSDHLPVLIKLALPNN